MNIILLSGGSGKRLWPLSNEVRSKQFLKILRKEDGSHESMLQRMHRMILEIDPDATITIATSENQVTSIYSQLGDQIGISVEPCRRDTFPAIALASAYLCEIDHVDPEEVVIVCPVDPYVELPYFRMLGRLCEQAEKGEANLCLMGIEPTYPSERYGYILPETKDPISRVLSFKEKPDVSTARSYIHKGALWNAGVFAFRLGYVLDIAKEVFGTASYRDLFNHYEDCKKISFDYAVVEKESEIQVMRFAGIWKDLGTWNTLTETMGTEITGNASAPLCENTHVINELQIPLIALGVKNLAIAATPDGILVADKGHSDKLKDYVSDQRPMYEERFWGEYKVLDYRIDTDGCNHLTKHLIIASGRHISYQRHTRRTEMWTVVDGTGTFVINEEVIPVTRGDYVCVKPGTWHAIAAKTELHVIEVQVGDALIEEDIERQDWDWENMRPVK